MLEDPPVPPSPTQRFARTAAGTVAAAALFGIRDVMDPLDKDEPEIVEDWGGEPVGDDAILMRLDPDNPADSIIVVRGPRFAAEL